MDNPVIRVQNVSKRFKIYHDKPTTLKDRILKVMNRTYEEFWALEDINCEIGQGETVGLIGHNGSGKSTLLKLLTRIIYPNGGNIEVNGRVSSLLELGAGFHPDFTGRENIYTNAAIFGLSRAEIDERLQSIIDFSELSEFIDNPVRTYSSGMYMRLAFSVAVHVRPEILLIDEILAVGDSNFQKKCLDKIQSFKAQGITIVIVTHDLTTVERICDRAIWLDGGKIMRDSTPKEVITSYLGYMAKRQNDQLEQEAARAAQAALASVAEQNASRPQGEEGNPLNCTYDITLGNIELCDASGAHKRVFDTEESLQIAFDYTVHRSVETVTFSFGLYTVGGVQVYSTNNTVDGYDITPKDLGDAGRMQIRFDKLNLVEGSYLLDIAVHDAGGTPYDAKLRKVSFSVVSQVKDAGLARLAHSWEQTQITTKQRESRGNT